MIKITLQPEPSNFDTLVRQPGQKFLTKKGSSNPITTQEWKTHDYWVKSLADLYSAYKGVCTYSGHWIAYGTGNPTVEHYKPKSKYRMLAYEWDNYRLICGKLNGRKWNFEDVLDPTIIEDGWFVLDFPSLLISPNPNLTKENQAKVLSTVERLKLNDDEFIKLRDSWLKPYCLAEVTYDYFKRNAPFTVQELERQNLLPHIQHIMAYPAVPSNE